MSALPPPNASVLTFQELRDLDLRNALEEVELVSGPSYGWSADEWERRGIDDLDGLLCSSISFCLGPAPRDVLIFTSECIADSTREKTQHTKPKNPGGVSAPRRLESQSDTLTKITDNVSPRKESPTRQREKSPIRQFGKSPTDGVPVTLWVCPPEYLESLLMKLGQQEWITKVRLSGLLILLDFIIRKFKSKQSKDGRGRRLRISADLAHGFCSSITDRAVN